MFLENETFRLERKTDQSFQADPFGADRYRQNSTDSLHHHLLNWYDWQKILGF